MSGHFAPDAGHTRLSRTGVVAAATLGSRILGFLRDMAIAAVLGTGPWADAFFVAFRIPEAMRRLLGEGTVSMAVAPALTQAKEHAGKEGMFALGRGLLWWTLGLSLAGIGLCMAAAPEIMPWLTSGMAHSPPLQAYTSTLLMLMLPYIALAACTGLCMGLLHLQGRFLAPALSPCVLNVVLIVTAGLGALTGLDAGLCLALGLLVAGVGQLLLQQRALRQEGFGMRGEVRWRGRALMAVAKGTPMTMLGASALQIMLLVASFWGTSLGMGIVSALYFAERLLQFPVGLTGGAASIVATPELAALHEKGAHDAFDQALQAMLRLCFLVALPAAVGLLVLAEPIVAVLLGRGAFDAQSVAQTARLLAILSLALPALALSKPLLAGAYAKGLRRHALLAAGAGVCVFLGATGVTTLILPEHSLAAGITAGVWAQAWILWRGVIQSATVPGSEQRWGWIMRIIVISVGLGAGLLLQDRALPPGDWWRVASIPLWMGSYVGVCLCADIPEAKIMLRAFRGAKAKRGRE